LDEKVRHELQTPGSRHIRAASIFRPALHSQSTDALAQQRPWLIVISVVAQLLPSLALAAALTEPHTAFVVGLVASPECICRDSAQSRVIFSPIRNHRVNVLALYAISGLSI